MGIHTPELPSEYLRSAVQAEVRKRRLDFPHLLDNDYTYWNLLGNHYWPAIYLVDRCGRIRERAIGEVLADEPSGRGLDAQIETLLAESLADCGPLEAGSARR